MIFHSSKQKFRKISIVFSDFYHDWKNIATIENRVSQLSACLNSITLRERNKGSPPRATNFQGIRRVESVLWRS